MVQAVETDGVTKTLTKVIFPTKALAQLWALKRVIELNRTEQAVMQSRNRGLIGRRAQQLLTISCHDPFAGRI